MNLQLQPVVPVENQSKFEPFAVVLCGGGAKGRWQAGVLAALAQNSVLHYTDVILGTSVGSINAALFSQFAQPVTPNATDHTTEFTHAIDTWENIKDNGCVFKGSLPPKNIFDFFGLASKVIGKAPSLLDPSPLYSTMDFVFGNMTLETIKEVNNIHLVVSSADLNATAAEFYCSFNGTRNMKVTDAIRRSSAIPIVFPSQAGKDATQQTTFDHWHVDGGLGVNNPFIGIELYNNSYPGRQIKKVIVIYCCPDTRFISPVPYKAALDVAFRLPTAVMEIQEQMVEAQIKIARELGILDVYECWPAIDTGDSIDFTDNKNLLKNGYDYGMSKLQEIVHFLGDKK